MGRVDFGRAHAFARIVKCRLADFWRGERGNIATMVAILIIPFAGVLALAGEVSGWFAIQRAMQNAADSAAVAAASNANATTFQNEARSVASSMSFTHGVNNTTVVAQNVACPGGGLNECYKVTITKNVSIYLAQIVGYAGSAGNGVETVVASAVAGRKNITTVLCLTALGTGLSGNTKPIEISGGTNVNMAGCGIGTTSTASNPMKCTGGSWTGEPLIAASAGSPVSCQSATSMPNSTIVDSYSGLANNIPATTCPANPPIRLISGSLATLPSGCGTLKLTGNATLNTSGPLYIYNGQLDLNGFTLSTASGQNVTIVFSRVSGSNYAPFAGSDGTLDIQAPSSGTWSGVALYQAGLTSPVSQTFNGGSGVNWNVTGLIYLPKTNLRFNGAVNKSQYGVACTPMVVNSLDLNGSNSLSLLSSPSQCPLAGLANPPSVVTSNRILLTG